MPVLRKERATTLKGLDDVGARELQNHDLGRLRRRLGSLA